MKLRLPANLSSFTVDHNRLTGSISPDWELNKNLNWLVRSGPAGLTAAALLLLVTWWLLGSGLLVVWTWE